MCDKTQDHFDIATMCDKIQDHFDIATMGDKTKEQWLREWARLTCKVEFLDYKYNEEKELRETHGLTIVRQQKEIRAFREQLQQRDQQLEQVKQLCESQGEELAELKKELKDTVRRRDKLFIEKHRKHEASMQETQRCEERIAEMLSESEKTLKKHEEEKHRFVQELRLKDQQINSLMKKNRQDILESEAKVREAAAEYKKQLDDVKTAFEQQAADIRQASRVVAVSARTDCASEIKKISAERKKESTELKSIVRTQFEKIEELDVMLGQSQLTVHQLKKELEDQQLLNSQLQEKLSKREFTDIYEKVKYVEVTDEVARLRKENEKFQKEHKVLSELEIAKRAQEDDEHDQPEPPPPTPNPRAAEKKLNLKIHQLEIYIKRFKEDLHTCLESITDFKELKRKVLKLKSRYLDPDGKVEVDPADVIVKTLKAEKASLQTELDSSKKIIHLLSQTLRDYKHKTTERFQNLERDYRIEINAERSENFRLEHENHKVKSWQKRWEAFREKMALRRIRK